MVVRQTAGYDQTQKITDPVRGKGRFCGGSQIKVLREETETKGGIERPNSIIIKAREKTNFILQAKRKVGGGVLIYGK